MYLSSRVALVRNLAVALANGGVTLIILLIAPMGLAGVIANTLLVTLASFLNAMAGDQIIRFLQFPSSRHREVPRQPLESEYHLRRSDSSPTDLDRS